MQETPHLRAVAVAIALCIAGAVSAIAQDKKMTDGAAPTATQEAMRFDVLKLSDWDYRDLYRCGWSARRLIDADVHGLDGNEVGEVENVLVRKNGKVAAIIAEVGGFWDIGDTHVAVPWDAVEVESYDWVTIPVTEETVADYSVFRMVKDVGCTKKVTEDVVTAPRTWKATELLDDYVFLSDDSGYGYVSDLIFGKDGKIKSVVVSPTSGYGRYGPRAYPFYGYHYAWNPARDYYQLPYSRVEVSKAELFDHDRLRDNIFGG